MKSATRTRFPRPGVLGVLLFVAVLSACEASSCDLGPFPDYPFPVSPEPRCEDAADSGSIPTETTLPPGSKPLSRDAATLAAFYNATDGPNWYDNTRWLTDAPISDWSGVTASNIVNGGVVGECVVRRLDLGSNQLSGEIPAELANLSNLVDLDLSRNQLSGEIPAELAKISILADLDLSSNQLSGEIPAELGNLNLGWLDLSDNQLSGEIPAELANLSNLYDLDLSYNQLSGEIPAELGNLPKLEELYLSYNQLSGEIPVELGNVPNLSLDGNQLSGRILRPYGINPQYAWDGSTILVSWDAADGADYYKVYYTELSNSHCSLSRDGSPLVCEELAANVVGTSYLHENPSAVNNYYWVVACNSDGCSEIDSEYHATPIEPIVGLANVTYAVEGSAIRVTWEAVPGADYYKVYYDELSNPPRCSLRRDGSLVVCEELAANVVGVSYLHENPSAVNNYYWVVACNSGGCSDIDSENPAAPIEPIPAGLANVTYAVEGAAIRVTWDAADGADYYKVYYDNISGSACSLTRDGSLVVCEELAANVVGTSYLHENPSAVNNYYWVVACNSGGCSEIDSRNPAKPIETRPNAPVATPSSTGGAGELAQERAAELLAWELGVAVVGLKVVFTTAMTWSDAGLGCPQPDMGYAQVVTPGYLVLFRDSEGTEYKVHTNEDGSSVIVCDK